MPIVLKSGNLNLLEPSGPVQACNGVALPMYPQLLRPSKDELDCLALKKEALRFYETSVAEKTRHSSPDELSFRQHRCKKFKYPIGFYYSRIPKERDVLRREYVTESTFSALIWKPLLNSLYLNIFD